MVVPEMPGPTASVAAGVESEPRYARTMYPTIGLPPLLGADQERNTVPGVVPAVALTDVGAPGTVGDRGGSTSNVERADSGPEPTALSAVTVKVYATPPLK